MPSAIRVLCFFAAAWGVAAIMLSASSTWLMIGPVAISAALMVAARRVTYPPRTDSEQRRIRKLVLIWTGAEGVAMLIAVNWLTSIHRREALVAVVALIVGAHFLPLANGLPRRSYYATAAGLIICGFAGLVLGPPVGPPLTAAGCALVLWATVGHMIARRA